MIYSLISTIINFVTKNSDEFFGQTSDGFVTNDRVIDHNFDDDFGLGLFKQLSANNQNHIISPISITLGFFMLFLGSNGLTASQLHKVLGLNKLPNDKSLLSQSFQSLIEQLRTNDPEKYNLIIANLVGVQKGFSINRLYENQIKREMKGEIMELDFSKKAIESTDLINKWVGKQTNGQISQLLPNPISSDTLLVILNAVYFKANWLNEFYASSTYESSFYNYGKNEVKVQMMSKHKRSFKITNSQELNAKLIELPYVGNNLSLVIVLPQVRDGLNQLKSIITTNNLQTAINTMEMHSIDDLSIPKFKTEISYDLKENFENKINVFSNNADLSGITSEVRLKVSKMIHKVALEVNEKGTEASAVTYLEAVPMSATSHPIEFIADHPFLYVLRDIRSGLILFIGQLTNL